MAETGFNPFADDDDDEDQTPTPAADKNKPFADLRKHARSLEKQLKDATPELEALRAYKLERDEAERKGALKDVFTAVGLKEAQISLYPADAEPTEAAIRTWATQYELVPTGTDTNSVPAPAPAPQGFSPVVTGAGPTPRGKLTRDEWLQVTAKDPARGRQLLESGQVDTSEIDRLSATAP